MYQQTKRAQERVSEDEFKKLETIVYETLVSEDLLKSDTSEWDMDADYVIEWACIWNKPNNIGKKCKIYQKNDKFALVTINGKGELPDCIYRLEDLIKV